MAEARRTTRAGTPGNVRLKTRNIVALVIVLSAALLSVINLFEYDYKDLLASILTHSVHIEPVDKFNDDLASATKPFDGTKFNLEQIFGAEPVWGTLNSGHYFSMKLSSPSSPEISFLWFENKLNPYGRLDIRHLCNQDDRLNSYSWIRHDFHTFGQQNIIDNDLNIETSFVKNPINSFEWQARVNVSSISGRSTFRRPVSLLQYITTNDPSDTLYIKKSANHLSGEENIVFQVDGHSLNFKDFDLSIRFDSNGDNFVLGSKLVAQVDKSRWPISTFIESKLTTVSQDGEFYYVLSENTSLEDQVTPNLLVYQLVIKSPSSFTISFKQKSSSESVNKWSSKDYSEKLKAKIHEFDKKFEKKFPYTSFASVNISRNTVDKFARVSLSNMLGSIGYFYGVSYIGSSVNQDKIAPYGPVQLLTAVPSRSFFPRGFLWDEGFHHLLISEWDPELSNKIIRSWFAIMNENGWIPREVILGIESMRRVPNEFVIQRIANANPPSLLLVIEKMLIRGTLTQKTIDDIFPKLVRWYNWFKTTQSGPRKSTFRWRGRDDMSISMLNPKTLTSGLDDYPRASHPSEQEYHLDLRCWMALASRVLTSIAQKFPNIEFEAVQDAIELSDNSLLSLHHWSEENQMFCDFGLNSKSVRLVKVMKKRRKSGHDRDEIYYEYERRVDDKPEFGCVPEFGYVGLFPMLLQVLEPNSRELGIILDRLRNENELWSKYGIRSLSKTSRYYNKHNTENDKPYWRAPIWLNINYLILSSLEYYSKTQGAYRQKSFVLYKDLKENLVNNVLNEYRRTDYFWENYNDLTGRGQGSHPFTGWSSLILLIMSNKE